MPLRTFTVTGTLPAPRTAARTRRAISRGFSGIALPPPWRVIFGAGHPAEAAERVGGHARHGGQDDGRPDREGAEDEGAELAQTSGGHAPIERAREACDGGHRAPV